MCGEGGGGGWGVWWFFFFFFQAEDGIRDDLVTGVQTCALPIYECDFTNYICQAFYDVMVVSVIIP